MKPDPRPESSLPGVEILDSISDGVFTIDGDWRVTSFNRAAEKITGVPRCEALGRLCSEVFRSSMCECDCALRETLATGRPIIGRTGYIVNAEGSRIPVSISTAVLRDERGKIVGGAETFHDINERESARAQFSGRTSLGRLSTRNPEMKRLLEMLPTVAASQSTVLLLGETGTGKELLARTIHELSPRSGGPFVAVNCGALPDALLESELFGYKAGAFTGARGNKPGRFAAARGGTIFLDEIGEVSPALQVRLLRVLQERSYEPLGSVTPVPADVRILAATNRDLQEEMRAGRFREDLYYRINVVRLRMPPLRDRKEDIPLLVETFVARFNQRLDREVAGVAPEALGLLRGHDWPGNVRELENVIERAFVMCGAGPIRIEHLPRDMILRGGGQDRTPSIRDARSAVDAQAVREALIRCRGNRAQAARELGIHKSTLFRLIKRLGIEPPTIDGRSRRRDAEEG